VSLTRFEGSLTSIDWRTVRDAYEDGAALPGLLREVAHGREGEAALAEVLGRVTHGGDLAPDAWVVVEPLCALLADGPIHTPRAAVARALLSMRSVAVIPDDLGWGPGEEGFRGVELTQADAFAAGRAEHAAAAARVHKALEPWPDTLAALLAESDPGARAVGGALLGRARELSSRTVSALAAACERESDSVVRAGLAIALGLRGDPAITRTVLFPLLEHDDARGVVRAGAAVGLAAMGEPWTDRLRAGLVAGLRLGRLEAELFPWAGGVLADVCAETICRFDPDYAMAGQADLLAAFVAYVADPEPEFSIRIPWPIQQRLGQYLVLRGLSRWRATMEPISADVLTVDERELLRCLARVGYGRLPALRHCGIMVPLTHIDRYLGDVMCGPLDESLRADYFGAEKSWPVWQWLHTGRQFDLVTRRAWPRHIGDALVHTWPAEAILSLADDVAGDGYQLAAFSRLSGDLLRPRDAVDAIAHAIASMADRIVPMLEATVESLFALDAAQVDRNRIEMLALPWLAFLEATAMCVPDALRDLCGDRSTSPEFAATEPPRSTD
jgi:hypothetical protein